VSEEPLVALSAPVSIELVVLTGAAAESFVVPCEYAGLANGTANMAANAIATTTTTVELIPNCLDIIELKCDTTTYYCSHRRKILLLYAVLLTCTVFRHNFANITYLNEVILC
jgi:hypothetical protein